MTIMTNLWKCVGYAFAITGNGTKSMTTRNCWKVHDMDDQEFIDPFEQLATAWDEFKKAMWDEFINSKIGKFMIRIADKLEAVLERFGK